MTTPGPGPTELPWPELEDAVVLSHAARGEVQALACLYDRYAGLLQAVAERLLGERGAAEDLVHDVFLEAWRRADGYRPSRGSVRTWLLVRLRSRALDKLRSAQVRRELSESGSGVDLDRQPAPGDPFRGLDRTRVRSALGQLPEAQRQVLELAYFRGLSATEIAAELGCPLGTVKSRTAAALSKLRGAFGVRER